MAKIGLSKPYFGIYANSSGTISYTNGGLIGKYTECSLELEDGEDNTLYGDNAPAESDRTFAGGTFTMSTTDLDPAVMKKILGTSTTSITGQTGKNWNDFDDDQAVPYVGIGGIVKKRVNNTDAYYAFVLPKAMFRNPGLTVTTQGETIEWQTEEIVADIFRSDNAKHTWYRLSDGFADEATAIGVLEDYFGITPPSEED